LKHLDEFDGEHGAMSVAFLLKCGDATTRLTMRQPPEMLVVVEALLALPEFQGSCAVALEV
jgi:hypothetical protein